MRRITLRSSALRPLCEQDGGIRKVMEFEHLLRSDLEKLYWQLAVAGLGQWIKGHYAALSTIADVEPLISDLLAYWEGRIPQGALLNKVRWPEGG